MKSTPVRIFGLLLFGVISVVLIESLGNLKFSADSWWFGIVVGCALVGMMYATDTLARGHIKETYLPKFKSQKEKICEASEPAALLEYVNKIKDMYSNFDTTTVISNATACKYEIDATEQGLMHLVNTRVLPQIFGKKSERQQMQERIRIVEELMEPVMKMESVFILTCRFVSLYQKFTQHVSGVYKKLAEMEDGQDEKLHEVKTTIGEQIRGDLEDVKKRMGEVTNEKEIRKVVREAKVLRNKSEKLAQCVKMLEDKGSCSLDFYKKGEMELLVAYLLMESKSDAQDVME